VNVLKLPALTMILGLVAAAAPQATSEQFLRMPSMPEEKLLHKVDPEYPVAAQRHRIQGVVRFTVIIGEDGHIEQMLLISGHPLLVRAARDAAQQWIYAPTLKGGKPVRVIARIEVQFLLDPNGLPLKHPSEAKQTASLGS
jgi:TonB family protein